MRFCQEDLSAQRLRVTVTIPEPFRASPAFFRGALVTERFLPTFLGLASAHVEADLGPRCSVFIIQLPTVRLSDARVAPVTALAAELMSEVELYRRNVREAYDAQSSSVRDDPAPNAPSDTRSRRVGEASTAWRLTPREHDVLSLLVEGRSNKEIASALDRAEATVEIHIGRIFRKVGVDNRVAVVARTLQY